MEKSQSKLLGSPNRLWLVRLNKLLQHLGHLEREIMILGDNLIFIKEYIEFQAPKPTFSKMTYIEFKPLPCREASMLR